MKTLLKRMHRGQKGFTLIELLVVIAILGVISAVVALNLGGFFGEGTLQAANTELHQVQTAVIALMAKEQTGTITIVGDGWWAGGNTTSPYVGATKASDFTYGPFRAAYQISTTGQVLAGNPEHVDLGGNGWTGIFWSTTMMNWTDVDPNP